MTETVVDHQARHAAELNKMDLASHKDHCAERWAEARKVLEANNVAFRRLHERIDKLIWAVAAGAVGLLANVAMNVLPFVGRR